MTDHLPSSIETYLKDADFSSTEILVLRKLVEEDALTLRELAAKTGKSTGVLDQAVKKLASKNIIRREGINDQSKFALVSLQSIAKWMERDMKYKQEMLVRKQRGFESYIATLAKSKTRPNMRHYEGMEGMKKAYLALLEKGREMLIFAPILYKEEEDPLCDFRTDYFRQRRRQGVFSRIIAHDSALGQRFKNRDPLEYRETLLFEADEIDIPYEKIIVHETVACINHTEQKASLMHYPDLAVSEKAMFDKLWKHKKEQKLIAAHPHPEQTTIDMHTRVMSGLREFFLSRKSIALFFFMALASGVFTYGIYRYSASINFERIREKVTSIAATAALQFDARDMDELHSERDVTKPVYNKVTRKLDEIRKQNDQIIYIYVIRPTAEDRIYEFVADADAIDPNAKLDTNHDGAIDDADTLGIPGLKYDVTQMDALHTSELAAPAANTEPYTDRWGSFITGYAPIRYANGKQAAVLAVDMWASKVDEYTRNLFVPIYSFIGFFVLFFFIRLAAFNKSLFNAIWQSINGRAILRFLFGAAGISFIATGCLYLYVLNDEKINTSERLKAITATAAARINANEIDDLRFAKDMQRKEYQNVFTILNQIRIENPIITYVYILRRTEQSQIYEFVADADSNFNLAFFGEKDFNNDSKLDDADENVAPGVRYAPLNPKYISEGFIRPTAQTELLFDQWGKFLSGYAPIKNNIGESVAVLGADTYLDSNFDLIRKRFAPWLWFQGIFSIVLLIAIMARRLLAI